MKQIDESSIPHKTFVKIAIVCVVLYCRAFCILSTKVTKQATDTHNDTPVMSLDLNVLYNLIKRNLKENRHLQQTVRDMQKHHCIHGKIYIVKPVTLHKLYPLTTDGGIWHTHTQHSTTQ